MIRDEGNRSLSARVSGPLSPRSASPAGSSGEDKAKAELEMNILYAPPGQPLLRQLTQPCPARGFAATLFQPRLRDARGRSDPVMAILCVLISESGML